MSAMTKCTVNTGFGHWATAASFKHRDESRKNLRSRFDKQKRSAKCKSGSSQAQNARTLDNTTQAIRLDQLPRHKWQ